jgi:murein DD-endopeptidase MepM/ murein hydrolase activator NlpD
MRSMAFASLGSGFFTFLSVCLAFAFPAGAAEEIAFALPIRCELGVTCFVQNYVDHDTSAKARDYQCGGRTYDGHDGTDIRIPNLDIERGGIEVLASAAGTVSGKRDGVDDISVRIAGKGAVAGKECGNGVVIEHENGWRSQYCHMAKGSVRVKVGDRVAAAQPIGLVGLSGDTEFPHVHFTVRLHGKIVDPFAHEPLPGSCGGGRSIWAEAIREQTKYRAREILNFGFSDVPVTMDLVDSGAARNHPLRPQSDALVAYVRAIGLQEGDQQTLTLRGPGGAVISEYAAPAIERDKAQYLISSGRKRKEAGWTQGIYTAAYRVTRNDVEVLHKTFEVGLNPK